MMKLIEAPRAGKVELAPRTAYSHVSSARKWSQNDFRDTIQPLLHKPAVFR